MTEETRNDIYEDEREIAGAGMDEADESADENESKADKFRRLAKKRTINAIKAIDGLGRLSSSAYEYTEAQVDTVYNKIKEALDDAYKKLKHVKSKRIDDFDL